VTRVAKRPRAHVGDKDIEHEVDVVRVVFCESGGSASLRKRLLRHAGRVHVLWTYRAFLQGRWRASGRYLLRGKELSNFTYEIENADEIDSFLAAALDCPELVVAEARAEIEADTLFLEQLAAKLARRRDREALPMLGRRVGWYCVVRIQKPGVVVETGTRDGLGSAVIARALERNRDEGFAGQLLTFDVAEGSGWLVPDQMRASVKISMGDTAETMPPALAEEQVGVFIHDSLHTYEHERLELEIAYAHRASRIVLISDNSHSSTALSDFAREHDGSYAFFRERPLDHFYPGGGIGISVFAAAAEKETKR
jgi:Methyltransferase domain